MEEGTSPIAYRKPNGVAPRAANEPLMLPPGTSAEKFKQFTLRAAEICEQDNVTVITKSEELHHEDYLSPSKAHDMYHVLDKEYFVCSAVISPRGVPDVQSLMKLCNEFEIPVWPFSVGRNVGYVRLLLGLTPPYQKIFFFFWKIKTRNSPHLPINRT